jgi:hypothetical protein
VIIKAVIKKEEVGTVPAKVREQARSKRSR